MAPQGQSQGLLLCMVQHYGKRTGGSISISLSCSFLIAKSEGGK